MAITKGAIISDIELRLTKGKPSDDVDVIRRQISHWVDITRDQMVSEKLTDIINRKGTVDPFYFESDLCLVPALLADSCADCPDKNRYHVTLTRDVMWLPRDCGIIRVTDDRGNNLAFTNERDIEIFRDLPFSAPTAKNQVAYRENRRIFIEKLTSSAINFFRYDITYVPKAAGQGLLDTDDYPLEDELVPDLIEAVTAIGLAQMNLGTGDLENDGTDPAQYGTNQ